jgi:hypothetical protein
MAVMARPLLFLVRPLHILAAVVVPVEVVLKAPEGLVAAGLVGLETVLPGLLTLVAVAVAAGSPEVILTAATAALASFFSRMSYLRAQHLSSPLLVLGPAQLGFLPLTT